MKRIFALILVLITLPVSLFAQSEESTPKVRQKTFEKVWKTVNEKYFDANFGGVNWKEVRERYAPRVAAVKTDAELYALLREMLAELHMSHLDIAEPEQLRKTTQEPVTTGIRVKEIDGQIVVFGTLKNSSASESAIRPGYIIKTIDGAAVANIDDVRAHIGGAAGTKVVLGCLDEKDKLREITLERRYFQPGSIEKEKIGKGSFYAVFDTQRLADDIGYIYFSAFVSTLKEKVSAAIESMHDAPGIIIDLRGNGGGDDELGLTMAGAFFVKKPLLMVSRTRKGDDNYYTAKPDKAFYIGKIVILLDKNSGSASEQFAAGMQEAERAIVVGKTSAGADMDAHAITLPTGALFIYAYGQPHTPRGVVIEGRGVIPDIDVDLSRKALLEGKDTQLEAAIEFIRSGKK
jgi:carboxyl-terminal processing protease